MTLYLDASCVVPLFVAEPSSPALADLVEGQADVLVSDYCVGEACAVISRKVRERLLTIDRALRALEELDTWIRGAATFTETRSHDMQRAQTLVRRFDLKLRFPDALQIATAELRGARLITRDRGMRAVAEAISLDVVSLP